MDRAGPGGRRAGAHPGRVRAPQPAVVAIVAVALMIAAAGTARAALSTGGPDAAMPAGPAARPRRPCRAGPGDARSGCRRLGVVAVRVDSARQAIGNLRRGHGQGLPRSPPARSPSTPIPRRSRSASTARRSCCPRRSAAPSSCERSAWSSRGNVPAFPPPRPPCNGRGCGSSCVLPRPAGDRARPRPARQGAKPASTVER